ncbi:MAG: tetratricopeptide repeat protein [Deltaproteobacteria bacterium]|nr:tetratricopeptide repeat protein [Deltaproteobacteria bacterium]
MVEVYRKVLPKGPPSAPVERSLAAIQKPEEALEEAHRLNAELKPKEAIAMYRRALELDPSNLVAASELGSTLVDAGHTEEAFRFFDEFLERHPREAEVRLAYAGGLLRVGQLERAVAECQRCLEHRPNWDAPYPPMIRALHRLRRGLEAQAALSAFRPLSKDPRTVAMFEAMLRG